MIGRARELAEAQVALLDAFKPVKPDGTIARDHQKVWPMTETVLFRKEESFAVITLNRPDKLNSFTGTMHERLAEILSEVKRDKTIRALLLTGTGRAFSTGQDLADPATAPAEPMPDLRRVLERHYSPLIKTLRTLPIPIVCAVNGAAAGAGANIALACDIVLAAKSAKFIQPFCNLGLVPDSGGTWILPRLVGHARAMGLALLGDTLTGEQAALWGLIWKAVDDAQLMDEALKLTRHLSTRPTKGLALIKRALLESQGNSLDAQLTLECELQSQAGFSHDYKEGVRAFMEKRIPNFKGE